MQTARLKLQQLSYFLDAARAKSFTRAAEKNFTSQSNISYAIRELERTLGVPLFIRRGNEIILTKYGEEFYPCAERALFELESGCRRIKQMADPESGEVKIGFSFIFSLNMVPGLFHNIYAKAQQDHRKIDLHPMMAHVNENIRCVEDMLLEGDCELGLTCVRCRDDIASSQIGWQELVLLLPEGHPLAGRAKLSLTDVAEEPFVLLNGDTEITGGYYRKMFELEGIEPKLVHEGMDWLSLLIEVASGKCLTLAPRSNLAGYSIKSVELDHPMRMRKVHLAWPLNRKLSPASAYVKQIILDTYLDKIGQ